jgi:DNA-binding transcriptional MerR regulator
MARKRAQAFRTITEVSDWLDTPSHVLRFWESKFSQIKPVKRAGGRRYYRPEDLKLIGGIKVLLHDKGTTIASVKEMIKNEGEEQVEVHSPEPVFPEKGRRKLRKAKAESAKQTATDKKTSKPDPKPASQPLILEPSEPKPATQPLVLEATEQKEAPLTLSEPMNQPSDDVRQSSARDVIAQAAARVSPAADTDTDDSGIALKSVKAYAHYSQESLLEVEDLYFQLLRIRNRMKRRLEAL